MLKLLLLGEIKQKEILNLYNSEINYINLPQRINGFTFYYKGINSIYINQNLSDPKKLETLLHEISFIELNNFYYLQKKPFQYVFRDSMMKLINIYYI